MLSAYLPVAPVVITCTLCSFVVASQKNMRQKVFNTEDVANLSLAVVLMGVTLVLMSIISGGFLHLFSSKCGRLGKRRGPILERWW